MAITDIKPTPEAVVIIGVSPLLSESLGAALPVGLPGGGLLVQVNGLFEESTWVMGGGYLVSNLEWC